MTPGPNHFSNDKGDACRRLAGGSGYRSGADMVGDVGENALARQLLLCKNFSAQNAVFVERALAAEEDA